MIFSALLLLILAGALIFIFFLSTKQQNLRAAEQSEFLSKTTEIALQQLQNSLESAEEQQAQSRSLFDKMTQTSQSDLQRQQELTQKSMDLALTRALSGSSETMKHLTSTLQSTLTMLGTKDPIAYSQIYNGGSPSQDDNTEPYTAVDEAAYEEARQDQLNQQQLEEALASLANITKVGTNGAAGGVEPYPQFPSE